MIIEISKTNNNISINGEDALMLLLPTALEDRG